MDTNLKIKFVDFADDFSDKDNFFLKLLSKYYDIQISDSPDILFYSNFGYAHLKYKCKKVFYSGENITPNTFFCDYSFSFSDTDNSNFFLPHFVEYGYFLIYKSQLRMKILHFTKSIKKISFVIL